MVIMQKTRFVKNVTVCPHCADRRIWYYTVYTWIPIVQRNVPGAGDIVAQWPTARESILVKVSELQSPLSVLSLSQGPGLHRLTPINGVEPSSFH